MPCRLMFGTWHAPLCSSPAIRSAPYITGFRISCGRIPEASRAAAVLARGSTRSGIALQCPVWQSSRHHRRRQDPVVSSGRSIIVAASRGRAAEEEPMKDPAQPAGNEPSRGNPELPPEQQRRQAFGPEPPPVPLRPTEVDSRALLSTVRQVEKPGAAAPKRRGRPPKRSMVEATSLQQPAPIGQPTKTVPIAGASAATLAAVAEMSSSKSSSKESYNSRQPFGPEPPLPKEQQHIPGSGMPFPFSLPEDPTELNVDDILNLPLPDPRVGEVFNLGGDLSELAEMGEAAGVEASSGIDNNSTDDDADLDYDELIGLAGRVDAASYVARAFERAKKGLEPVPDSSLADVKAEPEVEVLSEDAMASSQLAAPSAAVAPPPSQSQPSPRPPSQLQQQAEPRGRGDGAVAGLVPQSSSGGNAMYVEDDIDDGSDAAADGEDGSDVDAEVVAHRRVALLVELLAASGVELEAKLEAAAPEVDEQLLALLERRYTTALALRQDAESTERIAMLYRALRYMYERRTSSAAERLLDDLLGILGDSQLQPDPDRRRGEAAARLRNAFTGGMLDVDVFTAAAALAEGRQAAAEALAGEQVSLETFKAEAMGLLNHAKRVQQQTEASLETIDTELGRLQREEPGVLEGREWRLRLEQVRLARQALLEREQSISALEEVLALTRAVELQMLTGRMGG